MSKNNMKRPPRIAEKILEILSRSENKKYLLGDLEESFNLIFKKRGVLIASIWYYYQCLIPSPEFIRNKCKWSIIMLHNYLKIAFRRLIRNRIHSSINILGLAVGIACCILISIYVFHEISYDKFYKDSEQIYRAAMTIRYGSTSFHSAASSGGLIPVLKENYSEVESAIHFDYLWTVLIDHGGEKFYENDVVVSESDIFDFFEIGFLQGDPERSLNEKNTMVITEKMQRKYFPDNDPIGEIMNISGNDFQITGIVQDPPDNSHFKYNFFISMKNHSNPEIHTKWDENTNLYGYIKLKKNTDIQQFEDRVRDLGHQYAIEYLEKRDWSYTYFLQKITDIHLNSRLRDEFETPGSKSNVYFVSVIGILILVISCFNYINLATASSALMSKEVGLRKVVGAKRGQLIYQFLGESFVFSFAALIIAVVLALISVKYFNQLVNKDFSISNIFQPYIIFFTIVLTTIVGILSGSYPALFLSRFNPYFILQKHSTGIQGKSILRKIYVISQFTVSSILIAGTLIVYQQVNFMKSRDLGFNKEQKIAIPVKRGTDFESVKDEFLDHNNITAATACRNVPGRGHWNVTTRLHGKETKEWVMNYLFFDHDFIPEYEIEIVAGRAFDKEISTDVNGAFIINEKAVEVFGWGSPEEAIGKIIEGLGRGPEYKRKIIGVTRDFHYYGLQDEIRPLIMLNNPRVFQSISLTVNSDKIEETISFIENKWHELQLGNVFNYVFLDEAFNRYYRSEERTTEIFSTFALLAIAISCFGLFSLTSFVAEQRVKEIGIRKVLGASVPKLLLLLSAEFIKSIVISLVIGFPVAWYYMNDWLNSFAYRIEPGSAIFVLSGLLTLSIALFTVCFKSVKAAAANPVDSLRYE
ncbi:MAG: FtsX-like permease family protein [bacterium]|nr:FtsX-like permease family protein [bacterium]